MRGFLIIVILLFLAFLANLLNIRTTQSFGGEAVMVLGLILISSWILGQAVKKIKAPMITGYLLAGFIFGPYVLGAIAPRLGFFSSTALDQLSLIDSVALGLIAFTAGGELKLSDLRKKLRSILTITTFQTATVFFGVSAVIFILSPWLSLTAGQSTMTVVTIVLLLGIAATANSPSTTVAVITELSAKGPITTIMLSVTVLKDVIVLVLFSVGLLAALVMVKPGVEPDLSILPLIMWEVFGSFAIGVALGYLLSLYIRYVGRELPILILALSFLAMEICALQHLSGILMCMSAGFYVENFTDQGGKMIKAVERYSIPVFIVFFTVAGAKIDVPAIRSMWLIASLMIATRAVFTFIGTWTGSRLSHGSKSEQRLAWTGFIGQAGVTLGLASIIGRAVPDIGSDLQTLIIATIAINQVIGPIAMRWALARAGEAKETPG